jgi:hypothetical protein
MFALVTILAQHLKVTELGVIPRLSVIHVVNVQAHIGFSAPIA